MVLSSGPDPDQRCTGSGLSPVHEETGYIFCPLATLNTYTTTSSPSVIDNALPIGRESRHYDGKPPTLPPCTLPVFSTRASVLNMPCMAATLSSVPFINGLVRLALGVRVSVTPSVVVRLMIPPSTLQHQVGPRVDVGRVGQVQDAGADHRTALERGRHECGHRFCGSA